MNSKSEIRGPKESRSPKAESGGEPRSLAKFFSGHRRNRFRYSEFGLLSDFGDSDFGFWAHPFS